MSEKWLKFTFDAINELAKNRQKITTEQPLNQIVKGLPVHFYFLMDLDH